MRRFSVERQERNMFTYFKAISSGTVKHAYSKADRTRKCPRYIGMFTTSVQTAMHHLMGGTVPYLYCIHMFCYIRVCFRGVLVVPMSSSLVGWLSLNLVVSSWKLCCAIWSLSLVSSVYLLRNKNKVNDALFPPPFVSSSSVRVLFTQQTQGYSARNVTQHILGMLSTRMTGSTKPEGPDYSVTSSLTGTSSPAGAPPAWSVLGGRNPFQSLCTSAGR